MNIIYETDKLRLENEYEYACLIEKSTGKILMEEYFYGDPSCGLIDENNKWAIVAGEQMRIWTFQKSKTIVNEGFNCIHSIRLKDKETVEILTDP